MPTVWPPQGEASFEFKMPCCECAEPCLLNLPGSPFATLEEAEASMADNVLGCRCYFYPDIFAVIPTSKSFSYDADSFSLSYFLETDTESGISAQVVLVAYLQAGTAIYSFSGSFTCNSGIYVSQGGGISLFGPTGEIFSDTPTGVLEIPEAACYLIVITYSGQCGCPGPPEECIPGCSIGLTAYFEMSEMILATAVAAYTGGVLYCE